MMKRPRLPSMVYARVFCILYIL